jgi:glutathione S-transferase
VIRVYEYWRSSASYRLRIALNLKGASYETIQVNIAPGADEQLGDAYRGVNPQMQVAKRAPKAFLFGETPGLAEITLIPQIYNAQRYDMNLSAYPALMAMAEKCLALPAFKKAVPVKPEA